MSEGRCAKHDNWHAHCQRCCAEEIDALRAEVERLKEWKALHSIANGCNSRTADALGAEVERLKADRLAFGMRVAERVRVHDVDAVLAREHPREHDAVARMRAVDLKTLVEEALKEKQ